MTLNFLNQGGQRMIAIDKDSAGVAFPPGASVTSQLQFSGFSGPAFSYGDDNQPLLLFQYLTPQITDKSVGMDKVLNYPYFNVNILRRKAFCYSPCSQVNIENDCRQTVVAA